MHAQVSLIMGPVLISLRLEQILHLPGLVMMQPPRPSAELLWHPLMFAAVRHYCLKLAQMLSR